MNDITLRVISMSANRLGVTPQPLAPLDYEHIATLFSDPHTATLLTRQAAALRRVARERKDGLPLSELPTFIRVINIAVDAAADASLSVETVGDSSLKRAAAACIQLLGRDTVRNGIGIVHGDSIINLTVVVCALAGTPFVAERSFHEETSVECIQGMSHALHELLKYCLTKSTHQRLNLQLPSNGLERYCYLPKGARTWKPALQPSLTSSRSITPVAALQWSEGSTVSECSHPSRRAHGRCFASPSPRTAACLTWF